MIVVTGGAGFIGSNIVKRLNHENHRNILVVDDLTDGTKFANLAQCDIADYIDKDDFLKKILNDDFSKKIKVMFHEGACSATTEWDGRFMMQTNYEYSKALLHYSIQHHIPFIYASSAATYGNGTTFIEKPEYEQPINVYGYSKYLFDQYVRNLPTTIKNQIVGLRYFNVYGPHEQHKGSMASVAFHLNNQLQAHGKVKLFAGTNGYADGAQQRDFIHVDDVADINIWFWQQKKKSGIFNVGTGQSQSFNDVANAVIQWHKRGEIEYIPFPEQLRGCYQSFTEANIEALRAAGYQKPFLTVEEGVKKYLAWLNLA